MRTTTMSLLPPLACILMCSSFLRAQEAGDAKASCAREADAGFQRDLSMPTAATASFRQVRTNVPESMYDIVASDIDKDGITDVVILDREAKIIRVILVDKDLSFQIQHEYKSQLIGGLIAGVADFDGDGLPDLAVEGGSDKKPVSIFRGEGNGRLAKKPLSISTKESALTGFRYMDVADFDGDGKPDILGLTGFGNLFSFHNMGKRNFAVANREYRYGGGFADGDFDKDGKGDCFIYNYDDHSVAFLKGNGDGTFEMKFSKKIENAGFVGFELDLYAAFLDKDNNLDLLGDGIGANGIWTMSGKGNGKLVKKRYLPYGKRMPYGAAPADFNNDGVIDLVAAASDGVHFYRGLGNRLYSDDDLLAEGLDFKTIGVAGTTHIGHGDFDRNGVEDFVGAQAFVDTRNNRRISSLIFFLGGKIPASLAISNLQTTTLQLEGSDVILKGSFDFSGNDVCLRYLPGGTDPRESAYICFKLNVDLPYPMEDVTIRYYVTGQYLHKPGVDSGTVVLDLRLPSSVSVSGTTMSLSLKEFYMRDYNLVKSNQIF